MEAALIVGIVAAFLGQQGRRDALRQVWIGVSIAVAICIAIGVALQIISSELPQRQQEGLETVVGAIAVVMVTYMVLWMRRHARDLKGDLEGAAGSALARGSAKALVLMAFLAVLREGFETVVFLLATFHASGNATASWVGALLGIALGGRRGLRHLQGRRAHQPGAVLPDHRDRAGRHRGRSGHDRRAHGQRGGLAELRAEPGLRPLLVGPPRHPALVVRHRRARHPALSGLGRGLRLSDLPGPMLLVMCLAPGATARPRPPAPAATTITSPTNKKKEHPMAARAQSADGPVPSRRERSPARRAASAGRAGRRGRVVGHGRVVGTAIAAAAPAGAEAKQRTVTITLTPQGCAPKPAKVPAGQIQFNVKNKNAGAVSEAELRTSNLSHILGEQENLTPGLSGGFALVVQPGKYVINCPGAAQQHATFTVTGKSKASSWKSKSVLTAAVSQYATYVNQNVAALVSSTQTMCAAITAGNQAQAELDYPQSRVYYERIEPVAEVWGTLDTDIDGRIDNPVTNPADLEGFHKLEMLHVVQRHPHRRRRPTAANWSPTSNSSRAWWPRRPTTPSPWPAGPPT